MSGTKVTIGGQDAVLSYISPGQVNAQAPANVATGQRPITVTTAVGTSPSYMVTVNARQPGLFAHPSFTIGGKQHIGAVFANDGNTFVMPTGAVAGITSRPAKPGETILLFGIGFGAVTPGAWAGEIAQQQSALVEPVTMYVSQSRATLGLRGPGTERGGTLSVQLGGSDRGRRGRRAAHFRARRRGRHADTLHGRRKVTSTGLL